MEARYGEGCVLDGERILHGHRALDGGNGAGRCCADATCSLSDKATEVPPFVGYRPGDRR